MDPQQISALFQHTLEPSPETRGQAESRLTEVAISIFLYKFIIIV